MLEILTDVPSKKPRRRLPSWLRRPMPQSEMLFTANLIDEFQLETVCESAKCPNRTECWAERTATFMILGNVCTRPCGFCSVPKGKTEEVEADEPERVAEASARLGLKHVVITSVTRDDLPDGGAEHFYNSVFAVRARTGAAVEVLTPDFHGDEAALSRVLGAGSDVFAHNMETVERLQPEVRPQASYKQSLGVLRYAATWVPHRVVKSGLMLGMGETMEEIIQTMQDLVSVGCELLTLGQYLAPSRNHAPVVRYLPPEEFDALGEEARNMGFKAVASAPLVRSSYRADELLALSSGE